MLHNLSCGTGAPSSPAQTRGFAVPFHPSRRRKANTKQVENTFSLIPCPNHVFPLQLCCTHLKSSFLFKRISLEAAIGFGEATIQARSSENNHVPQIKSLLNSGAAFSGWHQAAKPSGGWPGMVSASLFTSLPRRAWPWPSRPAAVRGDQAPSFRTRSPKMCF